MTKILRLISLIAMCFILSNAMMLSAFAKSENGSGILCVAHCGDTVGYESNSKEAVLSAFEKGGVDNG